MKAAIHPDYHEINVVMTDGTKYKTRSTWGKAGDTLTLDVDSKSHPAWTGGVNLRKTGQMEKFNNKFAAVAAMNSKTSKAGNATVKEETSDSEKTAEKPKIDKPKADKKAKKEE